MESIHFDRRLDWSAGAHPPLWLLPNLVSLDAPAIAVLWQGFIASAFGLHLRLAPRAELWLAVWAIYLADRWLDVARPAPAVEAARHRFCREHRQSMLGLLILVLVCGLGIAVDSLRGVLLRDGLPLAAAVPVYLALVHAAGKHGVVRRLKEPAIAFLFTAGTLAAPWSAAPRHVPLALAAAGLFLASGANLLTIERFEGARLRARGDRAGRRRGTALSLLAALWVAVALAFPDAGVRLVALAVALSLAALRVLHGRRQSLSVDAHRVLADAALLAPLVVGVLLAA